ncbi:hypothetical protein [Sagittula stellata]|uniref:hypothetical protein n=1 Tax=Sagittula stellata TaxID=52603 RepID=UPI0002E46930|nr:hypothetical protein [Sagittula stellata]
MSFPFPILRTVVAAPATAEAAAFEARVRSHRRRARRRAILRLRAAILGRRKLKAAGLSEDRTVAPAGGQARIRV